MRWWCHRWNGWHCKGGEHTAIFSIMRRFRFQWVPIAYKTHSADRIGGWAECHQFESSNKRFYIAMNTHRNWSRFMRGTLNGTQIVPWGNAWLATTILFTLADKSKSSFFATRLIGVEMAVGVIVEIAVDAFGVFGVLTAAAAAAAAARAFACAIAPLATMALDIFDFFFIDLPNLSFKLGVFSNRKEIWMSFGIWCDGWF